MKFTDRASADVKALILVAAVALLVGELAIFRRPDLTRTGSMVFSDASYSLFVASEVLGGARLYQDVAYPYGWLPVALYSAAAASLGNTPTVYLQFFLAVSTMGLLLAYALVRRFLPIGLTLVTIVVGLLPVFLVPGALLGGYTSSFYMPIERVLLVLAALVWQPPRARTWLRGAALGAIVAALQMTRFGPGLVLLAVLVGVDGVLLKPTSTERMKVWLRLAWPMVVVAGAGELILIGLAFALLPRPIAQDVVWPSYFVQVFARGVHRWPQLSSWRVVAAQYANPIAGVALTVAGASMWVRRRKSVGDEVWCLFLLPAVFVVGLFTLFKTEHHLRHFAWVFVPGSVAALARFRSLWAVAVAGWIPVAAVVALSLVRAPDPTRLMIDLPGGWRLSASQEERARIEGIHAALISLGATSGRGPVMFDPNGAGFYVTYRVPHVSRQTWFYQAAVRPYELEQLERQYRALAALVVCRDDDTSTDTLGSILNWSFPEGLRPAIAARAAEVVWNDGRCRVFRMIPVADGDPIAPQRGAAGR